jgi:acetolactate synthase-1/2/3 large subunit
MNGAESLMATAVAARVDVCFANPGTTEMQLVAAMDSVPGVRPVLGLFEGVCTGAADGYARMTRRPALTVLHLGPGFANGIANLHNARRARSPIVNLIGDHATWHLAADAPLTSDIVSLASPVSGWVHTARTATELAADMARAIGAALSPPGQVASLIVPQDCAWGPAERAAKPLPRPIPAPVADRSITSAAAALRAGARTLVLLGNEALSERGLRAAARVEAATGCRVMLETFVSRLERGAGLPAFAQLPYFPDQAIEALSHFSAIVLAGAREPVAFFGYPDTPSELLPATCERALLALPSDDVEGALEALAKAVGAGAREGAVSKAEPPEPPTGELTVGSLGQALAALQPEGAIVMNEAATSGLAFSAFTQGSPPHTMLTLTGGAIGQGLPCAVGAAIACPERKVIAFQADGSGMYTPQALWTMARESLDVTIIICANRSYRILQVELARAGIAEPGPGAVGLTDLTHPTLDWVSLARGMGVPGARVETADDLVAELGRALAGPGPFLIEAML